MNILQRISSRLEQIKPLELVEQLILIWGFFFVVVEPTKWVSPYIFVSITGLVFYQTIKNEKYFWILLLVSYLGSHAQVISSADNHKWLFIYLLLNHIIYKFHDNIEFYKRNAQLLIGIVFLFATFWKIYGGEYLDGSFFEYAFLADERLQPFVKKFMNYDDYVLKGNFFIAKYYLNQGVYPKTFINSLYVNDNLKWASYFFSYFTLIIEGIIALLFCLKPFCRIKEYSDYILLGFVSSVYWLLPVTGFASLIVILGLIQANPKTFKLWCLGVVIVSAVRVSS